MSAAMKHITYYDGTGSGKFCGYRVLFIRKGHAFAKYFPDKLYQGKDKALAAAICIRDEMLEKLKTQDPVAVFREYRTRNNKTTTK